MPRNPRGPARTSGKTKVAQDAVKHGLLAQRNVIIGEDLGEFEFHRDQMLGELAPVGAMETLLAERVVSLSWRLRRAERAQNEAFDEFHATMIASPVARLVQSLTPKAPGAAQTDDEHLALGRVVTEDFSNSRVLDRLLMYERRIEHSLYRTMAELAKLRLMRELDPPTEQPTPEVNAGRAKQTQFAEPVHRGQESRIDANRLWGRRLWRTRSSVAVRKTKPIRRAELASAGSGRVEGRCRRAAVHCVGLCGVVCQSCCTADWLAAAGARRRGRPLML